MATSNAQRHLRNFVDEVYGESAGADPLGVLQPLFAALTRQFSFASGLFIRFDPNDWTISVPYTHNIDEVLMQAYAERYYLLDPYRVHLVNLKRPNEAVRMSEFVDVGQLSQSEFGDAMRQLDYYHAMAMVPFVRGVPLGGVAVHRPRRRRDFDEKERALFRWYVSHAARAMDYRHLLARVQHPDAATMVVDLPARCILALTDEARAVLAAMPEGTGFALPPVPDRTFVLISNGHAYGVRSVDLSPKSLWSVPASAQLNFNTAPELSENRVLVAPDDRRQRVLVVLEPIEGADGPRTQLSGFGLTPRQAQVALLLVLGKGLKEIARTCGISVNTAKEYVADVYERLDVHTRTAFLAKLTGGAAVGARRSRTLA
ncbi:MAG: hypothetical protein IPL03_00525 [Sterolibacteriaceae bacterium]|nr:hypothetical protein [Candidatus Methylophosphatis haderslevensis]